MTPDEAKISLSLCPPEDETNPDVPGLAEARDLATASPELGGWWEQEKNFDILFSRKLSSFNPPPELQPTIMRGGATIFFASRLIAESSGEETEEPAPLPDMLTSPSARMLEAATRPTAVVRDELAEAESQLTKRWIWRMGFVMVGVIGLLVVAFLFSFEYDIASKNIASKTHGEPTGEIAKMEPIITDLPTTDVPAVEAGPSQEEMRKYLVDNHAPNPPKWPALIAQPAPGAIVKVADAYWNYIPIAHFTIQTGTSLSHLIIFKSSERLLQNIPVNPYNGVCGPFNEHIWGDSDYIYIQLTPALAKP